MQKAKIFFVLFLLLLVAGRPLFSQAVLVKDINPGGPNGLQGGTFQNKIVKHNDFLFFSADDGSSGRELWKSKGLPGNTSRVVDLNPGAASSNPEQLTVIGSRLFFVADDGVHGRELWVINGSAPPELLEIELGPAGPTIIRSLIEVNNIFYFLAVTSTNGGELWAYDPSRPIGLQLSVKDGSSAPAGTDPVWLAYGNDHYWGHWDELSYEAVHQMIYWFGGYSGLPTYELWKYDISTDATSLVGTFNSVNGNFQPPVAFDGNVYFPSYGAGGISDIKLYYFDGTNITVYHDPITLAEVYAPYHLTKFKSGTTEWLYFLANDPTTPFGIGVSIGNIKEGTLTLTLPYNSSWGGEFSTMGFADDNPFRIVGNRLLVQKGTEIWRLIPGGAPFHILSNFNSGINESGLIKSGNKYFYSRYEDDDQPQVIKDDGSGPVTITTFDGTCHCTLRPYALRGGWLYFGATTSTKGWELWKLDPTQFFAGPDPDPSERDAAHENDATLNTPFALSPNPADESCTLRFDTPVAERFALTVLDNTGKKVLDAVLPEGASEYAIPTANLPKGLYFIQLRGEKTSQSYYEPMIVSH